MINLVAAVLMTILGAQAPLDGLDRVVIVAKAKVTARLWREAPNEQRRQQVAQAVVSDYLVVGGDRVWFRKVLEWACKPYDTLPPVVPPQPPVPIQGPPEPVYYYVPQTLYYTHLRGSCATGQCPR